MGRSIVHSIVTRSTTDRRFEQLAMLFSWWFVPKGSWLCQAMQQDPVHIFRRAFTKLRHMPFKLIRSLSTWAYCTCL